MLETIIIILVVLWLLGVVTSYTMGGVDSFVAGHRYRGRSYSCHSRPTNLIFLNPENPEKTIRLICCRISTADHSHHSEKHDKQENKNEKIHLACRRCCRNASR